MHRVPVLWEYMTTTLPISTSTIAGKSGDPGHTIFLLEVHTKAAWLRLCYLYCKK